MMEALLKVAFLDVVNAERRGGAPKWTTEPKVGVEDIADYTFDVVDPKDDSQSIKRPFGEGTASYVNGQKDNPYKLRFVFYDEYLHQFVFDDRQGHKNVSMLKSQSKMADFIVYDTQESRVWFVIQELSRKDIKNKRSVAKLQLNATVNMLCKSKTVKAFIDGFEHKTCIMSASDERVLTPNGIADAFMEAYSVQPDPIEFNYGVIRRFGFRAFETSKVILG